MNINKILTCLIVIIVIALITLFRLLITEISTLTTENETLSLQVDIALASHAECRDIVDRFFYVIEPQPMQISAENLKQVSESK